MSSQDLARLLKEAAASMKSDVKGAIAKLHTAYGIADEAGNPADTSVIAEELARAYARRKTSSRALHYARKSTKLSPGERSTWTTLAKTAELVASRTTAEAKSARARALYRAAGRAFEKAAALTKDPEDKRWLLDLARDAARAGK
jgi:hypothetical protein